MITTLTTPRAQPGLLTGLVLLWSSASLANTPVSALDAFTSSIGINTHLSIIGSTYYPYTKSPSTGVEVFKPAKMQALENAITYTGIHTLRDYFSWDPTISTAFRDPNTGAPVSLWQQLNKDIGVRFDFSVTGEGDDIPEAIRHAPICNFFEGPNEPDKNNWLSYQPPSGPLLTNIDAAVALQPLIYRALKSNPATAAIPIIQFSLGDINDFAAVGAIDAAYADAGNAHIYFGTGNAPGSGNVALLTADGQSMAPGKPVVATEAGYPTMALDAQSVPPNVQAEYLLTLLLDNWQAGITNSFIYELADNEADPTGTTSREYHFGLFRSNWTPKPAATAIHNMMTILTDTTQPKSVPATPSSVPTYTLTPVTAAAAAAVKSQLFQRHDGSYVIALWNDVRLSGPVAPAAVMQANQEFSLTLPKTANSIQIFDPVRQLDPIKTRDAVRKITISVPGRPLFLIIQ